MTTPRKTILFASSNPHKLDEVRQILTPLGIAVDGLDTLDAIPDEPDEDQDTFTGNAALKARYYAHAIGRPCLADDSGLAVDALGGAPGVHSARYAGVGATRDERDAANNAKLLHALSDTPEALRTARFVCAMCLVDADGSVIAEAVGTFEGRIGHEARGTNGFGYDPLLILPDIGRSSAELPPDEKNARSHRGEATRALARAAGWV
jgi:XTP/dITP diphosphohydrolase